MILYVASIIGTAKYPLVVLPPSLYVYGNEFTHPIWLDVGGNTNNHFRFHIPPNSYFRDSTSWDHNLIYGSGYPSFLLVPGNTTMKQSMLCILRQSNHWSTLWVVHTSPSELIHDASKLHSIWNTTFLVSIPISNKASSIITPTFVTNSTDISV